MLVLHGTVKLTRMANASIVRNCNSDWIGECLVSVSIALYCEADWFGEC